MIRNLLGLKKTLKERFLGSKCTIKNCRSINHNTALKRQQREQKFKSPSFSNANRAANPSEKLTLLGVTLQHHLHRKCRNRASLAVALLH